MRVLMICPELPSPEKPGSMAPGARQIESIRAAGIETEVVDMRGVPKLKYAQVLPAVARAVRRVELIHAHFGYCGWLALLGRRLAMRRVPIVMSFMGDDLLGTPKNERGDLDRHSVRVANWNARISRRYDQLIVKSQEMAHRLLPRPCHVVPNGVDLSIFYPMDADQACHQLGLNRTKLKVLFPGDPRNPRKGHNLACEAVKIAEQTMNTEIQMIPLWGVPPDSVALYMNACSTMIMTSVIEGSPNVVKEALACNTRVIGVPVGDVHEQLRGVDGCHCVSRAPEEIARALVDALKSDTGSSGREAIQSRGLSLELVAKKVVGIYELALSESHSNS